MSVGILWDWCSVVCEGLWGCMWGISALAFTLKGYTPTVDAPYRGALPLTLEGGIRASFSSLVALLHLLILLWLFTPLATSLLWSSISFKWLLLVCVRKGPMHGWGDVCGKSVRLLCWCLWEFCVDVCQHAYVCVNVCEAVCQAVCEDVCGGVCWEVCEDVWCSYAAHSALSHLPGDARSALSVHSARSVHSAGSDLQLIQLILSTQRSQLNHSNTLESSAFRVYSCLVFWNSVHEFMGRSLMNTGSLVSLHLPCIVIILRLIPVHHSAHSAERPTLHEILHYITCCRSRFIYRTFSHHFCLSSNPRWTPVYFYTPSRKFCIQKSQKWDFELFNTCIQSSRHRRPQENMFQVSSWLMVSICFSA